MDGNSHVRMLCRSFGIWMWSPVADLSLHKPTYPHSVDDCDSEQQIVIAKIQADAPFPLSPLPQLKRIDLQITMCGNPRDNEKDFARHEEQILRRTLFYAAKPVPASAKAKRKQAKAHLKELEKCRVSMFSEACKLKDDSKCLAIAGSIQMHKVLVACSDLAYEHGLPRVSEKIKVMLQEQIRKEKEAKEKEAPKEQTRKEKEVVSVAGKMVSSSTNPTTSTKDSNETPIGSPGGGQVPTRKRPAFGSSKKPSNRFGSKHIKKDNGVTTKEPESEAVVTAPKRRKLNPFTRKKN